MYSAMIDTVLSFITDAPPKCLVKSVFSLHSHVAASGLFSSYTTPPFCSLFAPITFTSVWFGASVLLIFVIASFAFSTSLPWSRLSRWLAMVSGALSTRTCLFLAWLRASVPAWDVGNCLLRASAYVVPIPFVCFRLSSWFSVQVVAVWSSFTILSMSPLMLSIVVDRSLAAHSVTLLISSLASSHMLYILSAACRVCLVVSSI